MHAQADTSSPARDRDPISGAGLIAALALVIALGIGAYAWSAVRAPDAAGPGHFTIMMTDYAFTPSHMTWRVGERVTLTLVNRSEAHPGKAHEFMMGRDPVREETVFGMRQEDGYEVPFFQDLDIHVEGGQGLSMLMPGGARLTGDTRGVMVMPAPAGMQGMQGMAGMEGMEGMEHMHGGHEGFMPVLRPVGWLSISFTVPDKPGTWSYGCFQQSGQHFTNGMHGTVTILGRAE